MTLLKKFVEERNKTILLIVHDINFASLYSDKIMAIKEGSIVEYDDTDKVITEEKLKNIYDTDIKITQTDIGILCNYYR
jgi:iron complex transport system ATP-binding protein